MAFRALLNKINENIRSYCTTFLKGVSLIFPGYELYLNSENNPDFMMAMHVVIFSYS